ncbi:hypothetical protein OG824_04160 [Streptomyces prunicolor]|uniref:hypothetical protein n=1 Tax=Streptomyces prunicolor TaxID=67348 RepID=UPI00224F201B|nr:hypothetical protein [Streptomyces prunicolor]MCX5234427.1 hypothetical protein [Streptomyces prunicolor]
MDAEVTAGWIGLVGASVGAAGALLGGWFQQRWQAKTAREERHEGYSRQSGETALDAFVQMQQAIYAYVRDHPHEDGGDHKAEVLDKTAGFAHVARSQIMLITRASKLRERLDEVLQVLIGFTAAAPAEGQTVERVRNSWILQASQEGMDVLSAFMRDEPIPKRSETFIEQMTVFATVLDDAS